MNNLVVMVGLPGSGKTTYSKEYFPDYQRLSSDDLLEEIARRSGKTYNEVYKSHIALTDTQFMLNLRLAIAKGADIVVDRTNLSKRSRSRILTPLIELQRVADYNVTAILMNTDLDVIKARLKAREKEGKTIPEAVMNQMTMLYEPIGSEELINEVIEVDEQT